MVLQQFQYKHNNAAEGKLLDKKMRKNLDAILYYPVVQFSPMSNYIAACCAIYYFILFYLRLCLFKQSVVRAFP